MGLLSWLFGGKSPLAEAREVAQRSHAKSDLLADAGQVFRSGSDLKDPNRLRMRDRVFEMVDSDPRLREELDAYSVSRADLEKVWDRLVIAGADKLVDGQFVPACALMFPSTLRYVLRRRDMDDWRPVVARLTKYFGDGEVDPIED